MTCYAREDSIDHTCLDWPLTQPLSTLAFTLLPYCGKDRLGYLQTCGVLNRAVQVLPRTVVPNAGPFLHEANEPLNIHRFGAFGHA